MKGLIAFDLKGAKISTEIRAGVVTFMTMSYIIFVQRAVLGGPPPAGAGMDPGAVVVVTCLASALACFAMGLVANYPIALAPVMGENFFFVSVAGMTVAGQVVGWRVALTATFISGALFLALSVFRIREHIFEAIPEGLKYAISVGIGSTRGFFDRHPHHHIGRPRIWSGDIPRTRQRAAFDRAYCPATGLRGYAQTGDVAGGGHFSIHGFVRHDRNSDWRR